mmetsp:Transcript_11512/g.44629  ORF Transcript_11512/g.44629 Transcript_11512/m.44629 type:complete len:237 (+) Transcript_11512:1252-1962(+)
MATRSANLPNQSSRRGCTLFATMEMLFAGRARRLGTDGELVALAAATAALPIGPSSPAKRAIAAARPACSRLNVADMELGSRNAGSSAANASPIAAIRATSSSSTCRSRTRIEPGLHHARVVGRSLPPAPAWRICGQLAKELQRRSTHVGAVTARAALRSRPRRITSALLSVSPSTSSSALEPAPDTAPAVMSSASARSISWRCAASLQTSDGGSSGRSVPPSTPPASSAGPSSTT